MKSVGIVVEYNPFHNGHAYHVHQAVKKSQADVVVAVMSGYFLQRGEPAFVSKWARTKMALASGVDVVVEIPYAFATQKAEIFANGAVSLLDALNVDYLCFGSENGNISTFFELVNFYNDNEQELNERIKHEIKKGVSYPKATSTAFHQLKKEEHMLDLSLPNNILGFHYVKALIEKQSSITPITIARTKSHYHDQIPYDGSIASATSIRNEFNKTKNLDSIKSFVPKSSFNVLYDEYKTVGQFISWENFFHLLKYKLLTTPLEQLQTIYEIEEGIESRLVSEVKKATSFQQFMERVKTKRFTWTRLQRICTHILTNAKKADMLTAHETKTATYIRLLGMTEKGQAFLNKRKKHLSLPLISNYTKEYQHTLKLDIVASHTYAMAFYPPIREQFIQYEYSHPPLIYRLGCN